MSIAYKIVNGLYCVGFAKPAAALASLARKDQRFEIDSNGHWVNKSPGATFVSPSVHTISFSKMNAQFMDYWTWRYEPREGDTVIDVGAGMGDGLVTLSNLVGKNGKVIAIEAHPETYACMIKTIKLSGLRNIVPVWCAVAEEDGELYIENGRNHLSNSVVKSGEIIVPARSLDSLTKELGVSKIAYLKMNIEGAEAIALKGMSRVLPAHVCISCHDFKADYGAGEEFRTKAEVRSRLESLGYNISTRDNDARPWTRDYIYGDFIPMR